MEAEKVIGEINTDDYAMNGVGCGCVPRDIEIGLIHLYPDIQALINNAEANEEKLKEAMDILENLTTGNGDHADEVARYKALKRG